jgi:hypothetical protein
VLPCQNPAEFQVTPPSGSGLAGTTVNVSITGDTPVAVTLYSIYGELTDSSGTPLASQSVALTTSSGMTAQTALRDRAANGTSPISTVTNAQGIYGLSAPPATYTLALSGTSAADSSLPTSYSVSVPGIDLTNGRVQNLNLPVVPIAVTVIGPAGVPVPGAQVSVPCAATSFSLFAGGSATGTVCDTTTTDTLGAASVALLPATSFSLTVTPESGQALPPITLTGLSTSANTTIAVSLSQAPPSTPVISNLPASGIYAGGLTAAVATNGDGVLSVTSNATAVCTASGLSVAYVGVGTCSLTAHVAAGSNYGAADGSPQTFLINQASPSTPTIDDLPLAGAYRGGFTASVGTDGDGSTSVVSNAPSVCTVSGLAVSYVGIGECSLTADVAAGTDYSAGSGKPQSFRVGKAPQTIVFTSSTPLNATVGGATYIATASGGLSGNAVFFASSTPKVCVVAGDVVSFVKVGGCTIRANQAGNADYLSAPQATQAFTVSKGSQRIIFTSTAPARATVGGSPYRPAATGGASGSAITFTSATPKVCTVAHGLVTFLKIGICTIDANQGGNSEYDAAPTATQTFSVSKRL